jgi:cytochrome b561
MRIAAGDDRSRYDAFGVALHWTTAVLVVALFALSQIWEFLPKPERHPWIVAHMSFGVILTAVIVIRIAWRLIPGHQVSPAVSGWVEIASKVVHYVLYAMLAAQALLGFALRWSGEKPETMSFFGLEFGPFFPPSPKPLHEFFEESHEWIGWAIIIIAAGHAFAALYHHYALKDDVLWRMLPGRHARRAERDAPAR